MLGSASHLLWHLSFGIYSSEVQPWLRNGSIHGPNYRCGGEQEDRLALTSWARSDAFVFTNPWKKGLFGFDLPWSYEKSHCLQCPVASSSTAYHALHEGTSPHWVCHLVNLLVVLQFVYQWGSEHNFPSKPLHLSWFWGALSSAFSATGGSWSAQSLFAQKALAILPPYFCFFLSSLHFWN